MTQHRYNAEGYWKARQGLVAQEASLRYDAAKKLALTPLEKNASIVLARIKEQEREKTWNIETDLETTAGMAFRGAIAKSLRETRLWDILIHMPKGALLHCHLDGAVPASWLVHEVHKHDTVIHVSAHTPMDSPLKLYTSGVAFKALPSGTRQGDIYSSSYDGSSWMSLREARLRFPFHSVYDPPPPGFVPGEDLPALSASPNEDAFDAWLHSLMTMTPAPGSPPTRTTPEAWKRFMTTFGIISGFVSYEPILRAYIREMFLVHVRDGIQYLEARLNFFEQTYIAADAMTPLNHAQWVEIFEESLEDTKRQLGVRSGHEEPILFDAKIIYVTARIVSPDRLKWYLEDCLELKRRFPQHIVGFDLVGYEDPGVPLRDYAAELLWFQSEAQARGLQIPFLFHAGETLGDGNRTDDNLYDALLLDTKRIGHGFSLVKHPVLIDMCIQRGVCIEVCPISNKLLRYTGSVAEHPLPVLLNRGVPVALSNDDPCQFGNFGLSHDFYQVFTVSASATLASLYTLARTSLDHSRLSDDDGERRRHIAVFEQRWQSFCEWLVRKYGQP